MEGMVSKEDEERHEAADQDYLGRSGYETWFKGCWSLLMGFGSIVKCTHAHAR
jgi:hypothetical protein